MRCSSFCPNGASLAHGTATLTAATLAALPYGVAARWPYWPWSHRSIDPTPGAQAGHIALPTTAAGGGIRCGIESDVTDSDAELADHRRCRRILAAMPAFWSHRAAGPRVAVAIATVNAGQSASFAGPYATGHLKDATGTYHLALLTVAAVLAAAGGL